MCCKKRCPADGGTRIRGARCRNRRAHRAGATVGDPLGSEPVARCQGNPERGEEFVDGPRAAIGAHASRNETDLVESDAFDDEDDDLGDEDFDDDDIDQ